MTPLLLQGPIVVHSSTMGDASSAAQTALSAAQLMLLGPLALPLAFNVPGRPDVPGGPSSPPSSPATPAAPGTTPAGPSATTLAIGLGAALAVAVIGVGAYVIERYL